MKKKVIATISIIIAVLLAGWFLVRPMLVNGKSNVSVQTVSLQKGDLINTVLVTGTVESSNSVKVYSRLQQYPVLEVTAEVGQKVKKGDVLAKLDTTNLENQIRQAELNIKTSQANIDNESLANGSALENARNSVESAALDLDNAKEKLQEIQELVKTGANTQDDVIQAESAVKKAQIAYDNAQNNLKNAQSKNLTITRNNMEIQKLNLDELKQNLSDATIAAPIDGTVTMVEAEAGEPANGLLFVVEDTDRPIIRTSIGEYDIGSVKIGQEVTIKTDSTGDREYNGTVSEIAPTALKDQSGNTDSSGDISFATEVSLKDANSDIRIGMNARLTIKLSERKDVYSVPYDAVTSKGDGSKWVTVQDPAGKTRAGKAAYREIPVTTGLETDMNVEISGTDLRDGLIVVTNPQEVNTGKSGKLGLGLGRLVK